MYVDKPLGRYTDCGGRKGHGIFQGITLSFTWWENQHLNSLCLNMKH